MDKLESRIRMYITRYMNSDKFGGKVFVIHGNDTREFMDLSEARNAALSLPGVSIIIAVPKKDEADETFIRFVRLLRES
ncbi:MAG: hypothetical protein ACP5GZ_08265 [Vulcanisaeta sp.]|jgi:hypothetical protein|uniref:Uncharacterized protein n=1 Tax=Vulcanisaeta moutnovskia (strain 768-28) TaxID=985053 RepID=F0QW69_VULM7|nr:hypothetical protein [Vulcanisaeta moutnovskia]ADY02164.1 hypothetical protein VMUT_1963 [Vulcanisaeta moutnovskia 768-28]